MEALPQLPKFNEHVNILNSLESRVEAYQQRGERNKELREALEMVYDEEVKPVPQPKGYFGIKCHLGNIFFPKAFLDTSLTSSFITFNVFKKLHKAELTWDKPRKIKHNGQDLKVYGMMNNYHVHIGSGFYSMNFMVIRHMNASSYLAKHDLVFGSDLLFQVIPRFNITKTPF
ncbi:retroviral-like aspartic protease, partial [Labilibacter sediminis]